VRLLGAHQELTFLDYGPVFTRRASGGGDLCTGLRTAGVWWAEIRDIYKKNCGDGLVRG